MQKKIWIPAVAAGCALALVGGVAVAGALATKDITLSVDGMSQELTVNEQTVGDVLAEEGIQVGDHDVVLPSPETEIVEDLEITVSHARLLELQVDGETRSVWTTARTVDEALTQLELNEDAAIISVSRSTPIGREGLEFSVETPKDITFATGSNTYWLHMAGTVKDVLDAHGISPDEDDLVTPAIDTKLTDGVKITYVNVETRTREEERVVPFKKKKVESDSMLRGKKKVTTEGKNGKSVDTYTEVYHDGVLFSSEVTDTKVISEPVTQVTTVGTKKPPAPERSSDDSGSSSGSGNLSPASAHTCKASYYWQPQMTASGERFNPNAMTAAHKSLRLGSKVKVTNPRNGRTVIVRINDRGPYVGGRCLDLSRAAMKKLGGTSAGVITVKWEVVG